MKKMTLTEAEKIYRKLKNENERKLARKARPELKALIGKCFQAENSYGSSHEGGPWKIYYRVIKAEFNGASGHNHYITCLTFQRTNEYNGAHKFEVETRDRTYQGLMEKEITREEFDKVFDAFLTEIQEQN